MFEKSKGEGIRYFGIKRLLTDGIKTWQDIVRNKKKKGIVPTAGRLPKEERRKEEKLPFFLKKPGPRLKPRGFIVIIL